MTLAPGSAEDRLILAGRVEAPVLACAEGLSFWGGVDPGTGRIIDAHHPAHGQSVAGKVLVMPTSRGSCSGSGVLLQLALSGLAPAALVFCQPEEVLTLGALVAGQIFGRPVPTLRLSAESHARLVQSATARLQGHDLWVDAHRIPLSPVAAQDLALTDRDRALLQGDAGPAAQQSMQILCLMAAAGGARRLIDVSRGHIDGCILAHDANLIFAEKLAAMGARVAIPTTINAISVDRQNWQRQSVPADFGARASRLADAYVQMGAQPVFTCAPYLLDQAPQLGETIGWSESNAVIYANSALGARSPKHPDYLDLFIAMTGRAPETGVYTDAGRQARRVLNVAAPEGADDLFWPLLGWVAGHASPDRIPLLRGVAHLRPSPDDLKALCAAFGTTSGAPMLHVAGVTPEAHLPPADEADTRETPLAELQAAWQALARGPRQIDLVAIGSPHASAGELGRLAAMLAGQSCSPGTAVIVTLGRDVLAAARRDGTHDALLAAGVRLLPDLCWCSITEPLFPPTARGVFTNSGKYAHYAHGLSGRHARLGSLADCVQAALTGLAPETPPGWLAG